jgi:signal peptidase I
MTPGFRFVRDLTIVLVVIVGLVFLLTRWVAIPWVVAGGSMEPTLQAGDRVLVDLRSYRGRSPRRGEIALIRGPGNRMLVKRLAAGPVTPDEIPLRSVFAARESDEGWFTVLGDHVAASEDSRSFGPVPRHRFVGRVIWRYWPLTRMGSIR